MDIIEKECPKCGGGLRFSIHDKTTRCEYCGKIIDVSEYNPKVEHVVENKYIDVEKKDFYTSKGRIGDTKSLVKTIIGILVVIGIVIFLGIKIYQKFEKSSNFEELNSNTIDYDFLNRLHDNSVHAIKSDAPGDYTVESLERYKTYAYNTKNTLRAGYSKDNTIYDFYKVTYSNGTDRKTIYQCVRHNEIVVINGETKFDETSAFYLLKNFTSGYLIDSDVKYYLNDTDYTYGADTFEELFNKIMPTKDNRPNWEFYSVVEIKD